jgi:hypothetical protein
MRYHKALGALLLLAAATVTAQTTRTAPRPPVTVQVVDGRLSLSDPTLRVPAGAAALSWVLQTAGYRFTDSSLDFGDARPYFSCVVADGGSTVRCIKSADSPSGQLRYSLSVSPLAGSARVEVLNPIIWVAND